MENNCPNSCIVINWILLSSSELQLQYHFLIFKCVHLSRFCLLSSLYYAVSYNSLGEIANGIFLFYQIFMYHLCSLITIFNDEKCKEKRNCSNIRTFHPVCPQHFSYNYYCMHYFPPQNCKAVLHAHFSDHTTIYNFFFQFFFSWYCISVNAVSTE